MTIKVCIVGLGETGYAMVRWAVARHLSCRVVDTRANPPMLETLQAAFPEVPFAAGELTPELIGKCDRLLVSPGISLKTPAIQHYIEKGIPVLGDIELFAETINAADKKDRPKIAAITGSNGKTTVTSIVGHMAKTAGLNTQVAGNISPSILDALLACEIQKVTPDVWVLELSSFQLETTYSLEPDAAVILNISEDHLDRYDDLEGYRAAKQRIFTRSLAAVVNKDEPGFVDSEIKQISYGLSRPAAHEFGVITQNEQEWLCFGDKRLLMIEDLQIIGRHNVSNMLGAFALGYSIGLSFDAMIDAAKTFKGLAHRVEFVSRIRDIDFYDDSKGTNVGATEAALKGAASPVILIAGGEGKGQDFSPLKAAVKKKGRAVILIGQDADKIAQALNGVSVPVKQVETLEQAVEEAYNFAQPGDQVLLSPACASFDMFKGYAHRAQVFIDAVKALKARIESRV